MIDGMAYPLRFFASRSCWSSSAEQARVASGGGIGIISSGRLLQILSYNPALATAAGIRFLNHGLAFVAGFSHSFCFVAASDNRRSYQNNVPIVSIRRIKRLRICETANVTGLRIINLSLFKGPIVICAFDGRLLGYSR
jgi:hypothetical protein